ncbi:trypsin-like serine protease [Basidiobolus meristosporus CBS 931.73]|uniref:Trypsin-like serine protease n=1 Tax=Basidiobolus meristosporus CBS 931.73 TaxID=1314790 RepID=A0A1Y1YGL5_9FUNG|nr:trypsin-like serine protease [Basidiobolus meristosporus CBS 931.73]|eukprot:ORX96784.1 trypsin-like serine protease [Basidiobolus meristosporus CBS 931.73]
MMKSPIQWLILLGISSCLSSGTILNYSFVIGGKEVKRIEEYPFMCHLFIQNNPACGGSIIHEYWILTAGHCLFRQDRAASATYSPEDIVVVIGNRANSIQLPLKVRYFVVHPEFDNVRLKNDIALVRVASKMQFNRQTNSIKISQDQVDADEELAALGWGETERDIGSKYLKKTSILTSGRAEKCRSHLEDYVDNNGLQICAETAVGDTCNGDSGGPLLSTGYPIELVGITSYAASWNGSTHQFCGGQEMLGIYTHVYPYLEFISAHTGIAGAEFLRSSPSASSSIRSDPFADWRWLVIGCLLWMQI